MGLGAEDVSMKFMIGPVDPTQTRLKSKLDLKKKQVTSTKPAVELEFKEDSRDFMLSQTKKKKRMKKGEEHEYFNTKKIKKLGKKGRDKKVLNEE